MHGILLKYSTKGFKYPGQGVVRSQAISRYELTNNVMMAGRHTLSGSDSTPVQDISFFQRKRRG